MNHSTVTAHRSPVLPGREPAWKLLIRAIGRRLRRRNTRNVLGQLNDAALRDIGLTRQSARNFDIDVYFGDRN